MADVTAVFERIDEVVGAFPGYQQSLVALKGLPQGYALCFAFHYVEADISNGGISQLYSNSTWSLVLAAHRAAEYAERPEVASILKEIIFYYHRKGRSRFKRQISDSFFDEIATDWNKSLSRLEDGFFEVEKYRELVVPTLCNEHDELFVD